ncbi:unnamed protein product [Linum trigynum]|uniref:Leucine-rich repeat-containing N-terminal plant-type domain-containing protein n=1 Tax=Linum trigynum TaxID=586398 RepID=A0AAV2ELQ2_9ROSI
MANPSLVVPKLSNFSYLVVALIGICHLCCSVSCSQIRCLEQERALLLLLKLEISTDINNDFPLPLPLPPPKLSSWNNSGNHEDCCSWDGVTCSSMSGHVVGLDLSSSSIVGGINGSSSIFGLRHLRSLSLAENLLYGSPFPSGFSNLSGLTHLNLSFSGFYGPIPQPEISCLGLLVSLGLSNHGWLLPPNRSSSVDLGKLVRNLTRLRVLHLDGSDLFPGGSSSKSWSSSISELRDLSLANCKLTGESLQFPYLLRLKSLTHLILSGNNLAWNVSGELGFLQFPSLMNLQLGYCGLYGRFPSRMLTMPTLQKLDLSFNYQLTGTLPHFPVGSLLQFIDLSGTKFSGNLPHSINNLVSLQHFDLTDCNFLGLVPSSIDALTELRHLSFYNNSFSGALPSLISSSKIVELDFSTNNFSGSIPLSYGSDQFENLEMLHLMKNNLRGKIPSALFRKPSLKSLRLAWNHFDGQLEKFHDPTALQLMEIDLSHNELHGQLPESIFNISTLVHLELASNNFSGSIKMTESMNNLTTLDLSDNHFQVEISGSGNPTTLFKVSHLGLGSCAIDSFPDFLRNSSNMNYLDLSRNKIKGKIPSWVWKLGNGNLVHLNLSHNLLFGFDKPGNMFEGQIPPSICQMTYIEVLDLSTNHFNGSIPPCLASLDTLAVLRLRNNKFSGVLPKGLAHNCSLRTLDVNQNHLQGQLPESLDFCKSLEVIDVGNNYLSGNFPAWLENLPLLRILILHSNHFGGSIGSRTPNAFPALQIFDASSNDFVGKLPSGWFRSWKGMMKQASAAGSHQMSPILRFNYLKLSEWYYQDSVIVTIKGVEMELDKILTIFILIDLSGNRFEGEIPETIASLQSLYLLNLSNNHFTGHIPAVFGELSELGSLDLSANRLSGGIPWQLTGLTFLSVLNLSQNLLTGEIPRGNQFGTFGEGSYRGNPGLCGPPLHESCSDVKSSSPHTKPAQAGGWHNVIDWEYYRVGIACGGGTGIIVGILAANLVLGNVFVWRKPRRRVRRKAIRAL